MATVTKENIGLLHEKLTVKLEKTDYLPSFEKALKEYSKKAKPDNGLNTPQDHIFFYSNDYQVFMIKTAVKLKKQIYQFITSSLNKTNKFFSPGLNN